MAVYKNPEDMFLHRAETNKSYADCFWAMACKAEKDGESADKIEQLKKQAYYHYNAEKVNRKKAEENKGKIWEKKKKK